MNEHEPPHAEAAEREPHDRPRIYVASLSDYNAGILHGAWIDADQAIEDIEDQVQTMLSRSEQQLAEEYAIHDYEGFGPLQMSEYESLPTVAELAAGITTHGRAFAHWANYLGPGNYQYLDRFEDCFLGQWPSMETWLCAFAWARLLIMARSLGRVGVLEQRSCPRSRTRRPCV